MLTFARELRDTLVRAGGFEVSLTREDDSFVPLETRITRAARRGRMYFYRCTRMRFPRAAPRGRPSILWRTVPLTRRRANWPNAMTAPTSCRVWI